MSTDTKWNIGTIVPAILVVAGLVVAGLLSAQIAGLNARIADVNARIGDVNTNVNARVGDVNASTNARFDDVNRRFDDLQDSIRELRAEVRADIRELREIVSESIHGASESIRVASRTFTASHLRAAYRDAVVDAIVAEPSERSDRLTPVLPGRNGTHWTTIQGEKYVLAVTWTPRDDYKVNLESLKTLEREVWITLVPQVREYCSQLAVQSELDLRLEQLLGLPPDGRNTRFVEMWARPADLFRPCPDPEIDDNRCDLDFPRGTDWQHKEWFNHRRATSYDGARIYPWTRLGYTYDWGNSSREVGLSEYVIRKSARVAVKSVVSTSTYCTG